MIDKQKRGRRGEDIACGYLKKNGYKILEKNFNCRQGEIDIIANDRNGVLCFVEVKARSSIVFGLPEESVTHTKQQKLVAAAYIYIENKMSNDDAMRFDVVSVDLTNNQVRLIKNAFDADM